MFLYFRAIFKYNLYNPVPFLNLIREAWRKFSRFYIILPIPDLTTESWVFFCSFKLKDSLSLSLYILKEYFISKVIYLLFFTINYINFLCQAKFILPFLPYSNHKFEIFKINQTKNLPNKIQFWISVIGYKFSNVEHFCGLSKRHPYPLIAPS